MSDDGFSDGLDEPNIEIQIKTLLGTTFDIKVSSNDTVGAIKKKISRVEGIPVYQQNLIFQSEELKDTARLNDSGIKNGSTLTLVSAMRGGPISTRRLSVSCEHYLLKELKNLLENSKDEMTPGSKVSVLVFKEGDIINLLRVIENEDGSYSSYNDSLISPPTKPSRRNTLETFEKMVEDSEMSTKIAILRKQMQELNNRRQTRGNNYKVNEENDSLEEEEEEEEEAASLFEDDFEEARSLPYQFLEECSEELLDSMDLKVFERNLLEEENHYSESEEIALKDKHRTKQKVLQSLPLPKSNSKSSLYNERKGTYSQTRQNYTRIAKKRDSRRIERAPSNGYVTLSRERNCIDYQQSGLSNDNHYFSGKLPGLGILGERLRSTNLLSSGSHHNNKGESRLSLMKNEFNENPYLLPGLHSNKLPDVKVLGSDKFLKLDKLNPDNSILDNTINAANNSKSNFLNLNVPNSLEKNSNTRMNSFLPDITSRLNERSFGPLVSADLSSSNNSGGALIDKSTYVFKKNSLESSSTSYCNMELTRSNFSGELPQTSYSLSSNSRRESTDASVEEVGTKLAEQLQILDDKPSSNDHYGGESISISARSNRVHLTRLVLSASEGSERPKSSPDSIELEEHTQDIWEIHETANERLKRSATCKVGLVKRRQGLEYNYDSLDNSQTNLHNTTSMGDYSTKTSSSSTEFGICSGTNFYMPHYLSAPSAIPPQYAPKHNPKYCDLFVRNASRSPLYSRRNSRKESIEFKEHKSVENEAGFIKTDCSRIQRLKNDEALLNCNKEIDYNNNNKNKKNDLFGYCNLGCATEILDGCEEAKDTKKLPPVIKKKSRCSECNKRLNITNIYNCRCGRIFCSQHRYSEVHKCTYDYKTEGRKILEQQNPLVTAEKLQRF